MFERTLCGRTSMLLEFMRNDLRRWNKIASTNSSVTHEQIGKYSQKNVSYFTKSVCTFFNKSQLYNIPLKNMNNVGREGHSNPN